MKNILILVDCSASINPLHKKLYYEIVKDICNDNYAECVEIYGFSDTLFKLSLEQYMKLKFISGTSISELYDTIKNDYDECHLLTDCCFEMFPGKFEKNYMYIIDDSPSFNQKKYNWEIEMFEYFPEIFERN